MISGKSELGELNREHNKMIFCGAAIQNQDSSKMNILDTGLVSGNDESRPSVVARGSRSSALIPTPVTHA